MAPCVSDAGKLSVVLRDSARSWNSGSSHTDGLGTTMPMTGKLLKYLSAGHTELQA